MNTTALFLSVFLACVVEAVEATTIVLAAGTARDWRSALYGVGAGVAVLAVLVAVFGPAIALIPLGVLRVLVGGLLLVFGLQWMRKAILRASGYKALHDEDEIYRREVAAARAAAKGSGYGVADWYAFTLSFKGVLLEGLEVAFIVVTFGNIQGQLGLAAASAAAAVVLVAIAGIVVRGPLSRVPENTMKFVVGIMLTSFGIFWGAEGAGATWPNADISLLWIIPALAVIALAIVALLRRRAAAAAEGTAAGARAATGPAQQAPAAASPLAGAAVPAGRTSLGRMLKQFGLFWYDFIVGDDWRVALAIVVAFALTAVLSASTGVQTWWIVPVVAVLTIPLALSRVVRKA